MDEFFEYYQIVSEHVQANMNYYIGGAVVLIPLIILTRKWSVPIILYVIEICVYLCVMHTIVHVVTRVTAWFKTSSSMRALQKDGRPIDAVDWTTPLVSFWDKTLYDPEWVIYVEMVFAVIVLVLVFWLRPMKTQKRVKPRFSIDGSKNTSDKDLLNAADKYGKNRYRQEFQRQEEEIRRAERLRKKK